jgi:hypothetical protein
MRHRPCKRPPLSTLPQRVLALQSQRRRDQNHNQTTQYQTSRNHTNDYYAPSGRWKFPAYNVVLRFEIPMETDKEHDDGYADECGAEGFA